MNIIFSRHAKRRINLYNIREEDVINEIDNFLSNSNFKDGKMELIKKISTKNKYPLKIVFKKFKIEVIVITVYPLRKGKK